MSPEKQISFDTKLLFETKVADIKKWVKHGLTAIAFSGGVDLSVTKELLQRMKEAFRQTMQIPDLVNVFYNAALRSFFSIEPELNVSL